MCIRDSLSTFTNLQSPPRGKQGVSRAYSGSKAKPGVIKIGIGEVYARWEGCCTTRAVSKETE
eukprot:1594178-Prorocentrum_lima.AAC.1